MAKRKRPKAPKLERKAVAKTKAAPRRIGKGDHLTKVPVRSAPQGSPTSKGLRLQTQALLMPTILTVLNEDLARLGAGEAVDLIRELLWAEARRVGLSTAQINVSAAVSMPDGGIDASVSGTPAGLIGSLLQPGRTSHQIKASGAFQPWKETDLR